MKNYPRQHLSDSRLMSNLDRHECQTRTAMAELLADLAEIERRKLYAPLGYSSLAAYCIQERKWYDQTAYKRILVARKAMRFPSILPAIADGRLHLSAVIILSRYLTAATASDLLAAAEHKSKSEIEVMLAERFPREDVPTRILQIPSARPIPVAPGASPDVSALLPTQGQELEVPTASEPGGPGMAFVSGSLSPGKVDESAAVVRPGSVSPLSPARFHLQVTVSQGTYDLLQRARELLSHSIPTGDLALVLGHALHTAVREYERRAFGAAKPRAISKTRAAGHSVGSGLRYIPAAVRRAVRQRDQGQCTFVGPTGRRCSERKFLQFDHVEPVSRGGKSTVANLRLLCKAHNQYEAESTFGLGFMDAKRQAARLRASARGTARPEGDSPDPVRAPTDVAELPPGAEAAGDEFVPGAEVATSAEQSGRAEREVPHGAAAGVELSVGVEFAAAPEACDRSITGSSA